MSPLLLMLAIGQSAPMRPPVIMTPAQRDLPSLMLQRGVERLSPQQAVMRAAEAAPNVVPGVFEFTARRTQRVG